MTFAVEAVKQRDALKSDLVNAKQQINRTVENLRAVDPHQVALDRDDYDEVLKWLVSTNISLQQALDTVEAG